MKIREIISNIALLFIICSCAVGPEYKKPETKAPEEYQEGKISWRKASPNADIERGEWWKIYKDPILDDLMLKLNKNNQDIAAAESSYRQSAALVAEARAAYFPSLSASHAVTSQKTNENSSQTRANGKDTSTHSLSLDATWEADIWGVTKYSVAANIAAAQAKKADLAVKVLSSQSSLAQYYFELRGVDEDQAILDSIVDANQKLVTYSKNNFKLGIIDEAAVLNYENSLHNAKSASYSNQTTRAQYQHAIAILINESPSTFKLAAIKNYKHTNVTIPVSIPSELLERRPDIASAEELMKQANAEIGIAKTAFFPSIGITSNFTMSGDGLGPLLSMPNLIWSFGPQTALGILDGGARSARSKSAWAGYEASVATYRQTILSAFAEVEDQLASVKNLSIQSDSLSKAAKNSYRMYEISNKQYISGIIDHGQLLNSRISYLNAKKSSIDTNTLKYSSEIALIKALGGGWDYKAFN